MDKILEKANELGLMIQGTELYATYAEMTKKVQADKDALQLMNDFMQASDMLSAKEYAGESIEPWEKESLQALSEKLQEKPIIREYVEAQGKFMTIMMGVQKAISEPEGEPIAESKIIAPNTGGKIITGF